MLLLFVFNVMKNESFWSTLSPNPTKKVFCHKLTQKEFNFCVIEKP